MNKAELIDLISEKTGLSKTVSKDSLEAFVDIIGETLKKGDSVVLTGFGTFAVVERAGRVGVNPATGKKMEIAPKRVAKFKPGKALRDLIA